MIIDTYCLLLYFVTNQTARELSETIMSDHSWWSTATRCILPAFLL